MRGQHLLASQPELALRKEGDERGFGLIDEENSHDAVVRERGFVSEVYDSRVIGRLPDRENLLWKVSRLCFLPRLFFNGRNGFDRSDFDDWLDLLSVMINPFEDRLG